MAWRARLSDSPPFNAAQSWKALGLLNLYRLFIASLLLVSGIFSAHLSLFGAHNPRLFLWIAIAYFGVALGYVMTIRGRRLPFNLQLYSQVLSDIVFITMLMHLSGGVPSGLGMLIIVSVGAAGIMTSGRMATLMAAIAALAILGEEVYVDLYLSLRDHSYAHTGLLGATYFISALLAHTLGRRARESEALAAQRGVDLANMQQLTDYVIQRMQTGVIVLDPSGKVRLINQSAWGLLQQTNSSSAATTLSDITPELHSQWQAWQHNPHYEPTLLRIKNNHSEILARFARLGSESASGTLIFLEDTAATAQQAQQMKLASLGRLTASIAHEIRNPLGAVSHANQLLAESPHLQTDDTRLCEIIRENSQRMNTIIENILQLSRRQQARPEAFELKSWLEDFVQEFCLALEIPASCITIAIQPADVQVRFDPNQLHQILWNLCDNGARYSRAHRGQVKLELRGGLSPDAPTPLLDIIDYGPGIAADNVTHIFEPFYTTESTGTGLGLYISRELCQSNQARLNYLSRPGLGGCFRLSFADPRRRQVA